MHFIFLCLCFWFILILTPALFSLRVSEYTIFHTPTVFGVDPLLTRCRSVPNLCFVWYLIHPYFHLELNNTPIFHFYLILGMSSFLYLTISVWTGICSVSIVLVVLDPYSFLKLTRFCAIPVFTQSCEN